MTYLFEMGANAFNLFWSPLIIWSVLASGVFLLAKRLPRHLPQLELDLLIGVLLSLPLSFVIAWLLPTESTSLLPSVEFTPSVPIETTQFSDTSLATGEAAAFRIPWMQAIGLVTFATILVSLFGLIRLLRDVVAIRTLIHRARPLDDTQCDLPYQVAESSDIHMAFSAGLLKQWIILPAATPQDDRAAIICHEATHHQHGDVFRTILSATIKSLFPFHPLLWAMNKRIALLTEICCDHRLLEETKIDRRAYADLLLRHVPVQRAPGVRLPLVHSSNQLKQRIEAMKNPTKLPYSSIQMAFLVILVTATLGFMVGCSDMEVAPTEAIVSDDAYDLVMELPAAKAMGSDVFMVVEQAPILLGGTEDLEKEINYPDVAKNAGIEGRVFVQFVVDEEGKVTNPTIIRGIGGGADEEALRVIQTRKFVPGTQRGERVKVQVSLPVVFRLSE